MEQIRNHVVFLVAHQFGSVTTQPQYFFLPGQFIFVPLVLPRAPDPKRVILNWAMLGCTLWQSNIAMGNLWSSPVHGKWEIVVYKSWISHCCQKVIHRHCSVAFWRTPNCGTMDMGVVMGKCFGLAEIWGARVGLSTCFQADSFSQLKIWIAAPCLAQIQMYDQWWPEKWVWPTTKGIESPTLRYSQPFGFVCHKGAPTPFVFPIK